MTTLPDWSAADKAYQLHHTGCATCRAAGGNSNNLQRCSAGTELWATYRAAGMPPHFTWLRKRAGTSAAPSTQRHTSELPGARTT